MIKYLVVILLLAFSSTLDAQEDYYNLMRSRLGDKVKTTVENTMKLSPEEEKVFWPLYEDYTDELYDIYNKRMKVIQEFTNYFDKMTDKRADKIWTDFLRFQKELLDIQKEYYDKFKEILPAAKAVRYFQMENKIEMIVNAKIADIIPFMDEQSK
ncbi:MAG: hypothetical protein OEM46_12270 [Ignavibacteria bacterium]|nr:hypothetical protein [Ignavibacteria bacterium]